MNIKWNYIKAFIVKEALDEMKPHLNEEIYNAVVNNLKFIFDLDDLNLYDHKPKKEESYSSYDIRLFNAVCDYIHNPVNGLHYHLKPELTERQLYTIKYAYETIIILLRQGTDKNIDFNNTLKYYLLLKLNKKYDIANKRFVAFYTNMVLNDIPTTEYQTQNHINRPLMDSILSLSSQVDPVLFTKIIFWIRARLVDKLNPILNIN